MRFTIFVFLFCFCFRYVNAQDEFVLSLDSIKNIKTTRYSSINEVGIGIHVAGKRISKFSANPQKRKMDLEKPSFIFRSVHGALINPKFFIGAGVGIDYTAIGNSGNRNSNFTFPIFIECREYFLNGNFNVFLSQRVGAAFFIDSYSQGGYNNGKYSGFFGAIQVGGRYVTSGKKLAIHFGVGYRLQHLQRKLDLLFNGTGIPNRTTVITIKHYVPIVLGVTF